MMSRPSILAEMSDSKNPDPNYLQRSIDYTFSYFICETTSQLASLAGGQHGVAFSIIPRVEKINFLTSQQNACHVNLRALQIFGVHALSLCV